MYCQMFHEIVINENNHVYSNTVMQLYFDEVALSFILAFQLKIFFFFLPIKSLDI